MRPFTMVRGPDHETFASPVNLNVPSAPASCVISAQPCDSRASRWRLAAAVRPCLMSKNASMSLIEAALRSAFSA